MSLSHTRQVMVDSGFWIAKANRKDQYHDTANKLWIGLAAGKVQPVVNDYIIDESVTFVNRKLGHTAASLMYDFLLYQCKVLWSDRQACMASKDIFETYQGALSVTDSMMIRHMQEARIEHLLSFDGRFDRVKEIQRICAVDQIREGWKASTV